MIRLTHEELQRLWHLSTVPTHSLNSLEELHGLVRKAVIQLVDDICPSCKHYIPCKRKDCECYESGRGMYLIQKDGSQEWHGEWPWSCMDFDLGSCRKREGTPCESCGNDFLNYEMIIEEGEKEHG